jgi:two-component system sporulation sensor kinase A
LSTWKSFIFWKIYIINLGIIFILLGLMFFTAKLTLPSISQEQYRVITDKTAEKKKEQISEFIKELQHLGEHTQNNKRFLDENESNLNMQLKQIVTLSPFIDSGKVLDQNGVVMGFFPATLKNYKNQKLSDRPYFQEVIRTQKPYISDVISTQNGNSIVVNAIPIFDSNQVIKRVVLLSLQINENQLFNSIFQSNNIGTGGYSYIVDRTGRVISHPLQKHIGENIIKNEVVQKLIRKQSGYQMVTNTYGMQMYSSYQYVPILDWGIVSQIPVKTTYESFESFQKTLSTVSIIIFILLSILTALYSRQIIKRIHNLYKAVDQAAQGNFEQRMEKSDHLEFGRLINRFNEMIDYIQSANRNLERNEELLREQKSFLYKIIDVNPSYIFAIDWFGRYTLVNQSFANLYGKNLDEIIGKSELDVNMDVKHVARKLYEDQKLMISMEDKVSLEDTFVDPKGNTRWVQTARIPFVVNNAVQLLYIVTDITDMKQTEELLRKSDRLAVVGELAAGVAHEIRNPLTSLKGFIQLLQSGESKKEYFDILLSELNRIDFIIDEFLVLAKPQHIQFKQKDVLLLLNDVVALLETQAILKNVQISTVWSANKTLINCEENQLKQVFINVLKNAIESMPNGGSMQIQVEESIHKQLLIRFKDEGHGIPKERLKRLGEPFYTTKEKGIGLGLMVSYKIIENHQGNIRIDSEVNRGTTVDILLPISNIE